MVKPENVKIVSVCFIALSFLSAWTTRAIFETLSASFGFFAGFYSMDAFRHGVPIISGVLVFLWLQLGKKRQKLADEIVTEVKKVVWPGKKELYSMTLLVCVILIFSGLVLGAFDFIAGSSVRFLMD